MPNTKRVGKGEFLNEHIPGSIFFDIDKFSDPLGKFPHTIPSANLFEKQTSELGIKNSPKPQNPKYLKKKYDKK
jgi:thiosulfate/3-mercaptopyruvate sulfurtransferase